MISRAGVTTLSELEIDADKDWNNKKIENLGVPDSDDDASRRAVRAATLVVAASDSTAKGKEQADYVCGVDAQVKIQEAIDALPAGGGEVVLLEGTYTTTATINMRSNMILSGMGREATKIITAADIAIITFNDVERSKVTDLTLEGADDILLTANFGIRFTGTLHNNIEHTVKDVYILRCYDGIYIDFGDSIWLDRLHIWRCHNDGIYALGDNTWRVNWVKGNMVTIGNCVHVALNSDYLMGSEFTNSTFEGNGVTQYGIFLDHPYWNSFVGCDIENVTISCVVEQRAVCGSIFSACWVAGAGVAGHNFYIHDNIYTIVTGCSIHNAAGGWGILEDGTSNRDSFCGNIIMGNAGGAISTVGAQTIKVNNIVA